MKKKIIVLIFFTFIISGSSFSQYLPSQKLKLNSGKKQNLFKKDAVFIKGPSMGFNIGFASIEGEVGFAIGGFAELKSGDVSFVPQINYWNAKKQNDLELAGLARFYLSDKTIFPYLDGGLGINFYKSDDNSFTKVSLIVGGGVELGNMGTSFNLLFDGKYKLIVNDAGNLSCFIFTAGMKFPLK